MNNVNLVGCLVNKPIIEKNEYGKNMVVITLAISRPFKNVDGIYETDFINCKTYDTMASNVIDYCKKGDVIAVKGRLQTRIVETEEGKKHALDVISERITFISSGKAKKEEV